MDKEMKLSIVTTLYKSSQYIDEINPNNYKSYCNKFDDSVKFNFIEILPESNFSYVGIRK